MRKAVLFVATGAGSGYAPIAPGTAGSVVGLLLYWLVVGLPLPGFLLVIAVLVIAVGAWLFSCLCTDQPPGSLWRWWVSPCRSMLCRHSV